MDELKPREKLLKYGPKSLTDEEVLVVLIGSGSKDENVFELSKRIIDELITIENLIDLDVNELMNYKGIGLAKACTIICSFELYKRIQKKKRNRVELRTPKDIYYFVKDTYYGLNYEEATIIFIDNNSKVIHYLTNKSNSSNCVNIDTNEITRKALILKASSVCIVHNHPSGEIHPSDEDLILTEELKEKLHGFNISLMDHLIIYENTYYSIRYKMKGKLK